MNKKLFVGLTFLLLALCACGSLSVRPDRRTSPGAATISSISPKSVAAGSPNTTLTIVGSHFAGPPCLTCDSYSVVVWSISGSNTRLVATFVNSGELIASVPGTLLTDPVTSRVFVQTWAGVQTDNEHLVSQTNEVIFTVAP